MLTVDQCGGLGVNLTSIDWLIMLVYFAFVLGIGFVLKRS